MAKTSRKRKSKQDQISEELKLRIVCLFVIFLLIISAMQLGFIGEHLDYIFSYLFGNLNGIVYLLLISVFSYIVFKASYPKFNGPKAVGIYFLLVGVTIFISATPTLKGMKVIQSYISQMPLNRGGFIGALLYGCLSALFDYVGSIIAAVFIIIVGIILLGSKFYFEHKKEIQKKAKMNFDKTKTSLKNSSTYFSDFFKKKQSKTAFFDDDIFEDEEDKMNLSLKDVCGELLLISQFTLYGDCRKGRRPNFMNALGGDEAKKLFDEFVSMCREEGIKVETGVFGAHMVVDIENDGPVTLILDSKKNF